MTISDWITVGSNVIMVIAIVMGPILAIQVQKYVEKRQEKRNARLFIFKTLMATRGIPLSLEHVQALNMIDLVFYGDDSKDKKVVEGWKNYLDHLGNLTQNTQDPNYQFQLIQWSDKKNELLISLLATMGDTLGYQFDQVHIKKGCYMPKGYGDFEFEQNVVRKLLIDIMLGKRSFSVVVKNDTPAETLPNPIT